MEGVCLLANEINLVQTGVKKVTEFVTFKTISNSHSFGFDNVGGFGNQNQQSNNFNQQSQGFGGN